jgi:ubiquinone/menaquinone biosynthesis C-methylase UbiE
MPNRESFEKIINFVDPNYKHRWTVYEENLRPFLSKDKTWLDLGCGNNADVAEKKKMVKLAVGTDIYRHDEITDDLFVFAEGSALPFKSGSFDVVTLRFVIEHIENPEQLFSELNRILRKNGIVIVLTTNLWSPVIFIPKLLPYKLRKAIMKMLFNVYDEDIFPTYHRFNSLHKAKSVKKNFEIFKFEFIQALNADNIFLFSFFLIWHLFTKIKFLNIFRSNIFMIFRKID